MQRNKHGYTGLAESGVKRYFEEEVWIKSGTVLDLPDYQWCEGSGWVLWSCTKCEHLWWDVTSVGGHMTCPICGTVEQTGEEVRGQLRDWPSMDCDEFVA